MRNLINFFIKNSSWFVFIILVILSSVLLFKNNPYQHSVYMTSANAICSSVYSSINKITSYFHLRDINDDLQRQNADLELEVIALRNQVKEYQLQYSDTLNNLNLNSQYKVIVSRVISNSISNTHNYITINNGLEDGVENEMGVIDQNGVVGIVNVVGKHSARIISLLNPNLRLSCKVKGSDYFGSLVWDGKSPYYAVLEEMPRHVKFHKGDTIITSGYSSVFPEGINVGLIDEQLNSENDNFFSLKIRLLTDFTKLSSVRLIKNFMKDEHSSLKNKDNN